MRSGDFCENKMAERMENVDSEMDQDSDSGNMEVEMENENVPTADEIERLLREADISDIPQTLIVTNVDINVFEYETIKEEFEKTFRHYDENATFQYFKSFRRVRVNFQSPLFSANARIDLHEATVCGQPIKCFFFQPININKNDEDPHLKLPTPYRQFLISPPASPPVDWEPEFEREPVINYDLISAIAHLAPGESHELHPQSESQPGIVVHVCEDPEGFATKDKMPIVQTKCPERST